MNRPIGLSRAPGLAGEGQGFSGTYLTPSAAHLLDLERLIAKCEDGVEVTGLRHIPVGLLTRRGADVAREAEVDH